MSEAARSSVETHAPERLAGRSIAAWCTLIVVFGIGLWVDLASKAWAFRTVAGRPVELVREEIAGNPGYRLPWHEGIRVLPWDLLDFRLVLNHGAVFGVGQNRRWLFVAFTVGAVLVAVIVFARWTKASARATHVAIALVLAGGVGNLYDRFFYGAVRDFLHMLPRWHLPFGFRWPGSATAEVFPWVFNIADAMLLSGMALLLILMHRSETQRRSAPSPSA